MKGKSWFLIAIVLIASSALAQLAPDQPTPAPAPEPQRGFMQGPGPDGMHMPGPGGMRMRDDGMPGMHGAWWKDSQTVQAIGLSDPQAQQIEKIFQDHRMQLVDLHANLEKAELAMEPMMQADQPNESQVNAQIDKIAQARAALEKSNAQMLFAIRRVLTPDQWKKLQTARPPRGGVRGGVEGGVPGGVNDRMRMERRERRERAPRPAQPSPGAPAPAPQPPEE